ncbi:hypothetical protein [Skermanella pratensis]|uniref:hypothetical protein n=1 Tax=Skermanella pratensis TaxID=2233999 RepID=UPI00130194D1|nr:hypothetical protein [Skermanella pratensis]
MTDAIARTGNGSGEFYRVVDNTGELMGEFPSSRIAREFARRMIEAGKASTLVVEWSNNGRRGELSITRRMVNAAEKRAAEAKRRAHLEARRRANLISGIAAATIAFLALIQIAATYMEARGNFWP